MIHRHLTRPKIDNDDSSTANLNIKLRYIVYRVQLVKQKQCRLANSFSRTSATAWLVWQGSTASATPSGS